MVCVALSCLSTLKKTGGGRCVSPWVEADRIWEGSWCGSSRRLPSVPEDSLSPRWAGFILLGERVIARSGGLGGMKSWGLIIVARCGEGLNPGLGFQWDAVGERIGE